jgi:hypothetical protein
MKKSKKMCPCGCGETIENCKCSPSCECKVNKVCKK